MALTTTSLASALDTASNSIKVTSATGATVGGWVRVDHEFSVITAINGTDLTVRSRGTYGGKMVAHNILAPVTFGVAADLPDLQPGSTSIAALQTEDIQSYGVSGAVDVALFKMPITTVLFTKATAAAMTLAAPSKAQDGIKVTFLSTTAAAHTLTYTAGIYGDTTSSDVLTFAAKAGASCTLIARGGTWGAVALTNVTAA
jgi:hypothetical protein